MMRGRKRCKGDQSPIGTLNRIEVGICVAVGHEEDTYSRLTSLAMFVVRRKPTPHIFTQFVTFLSGWILLFLVYHVKATYSGHLDVGYHSE